MNNKKVKQSAGFLSAPVRFEGLRMEMFGNREVAIEGCTGILEYGKENIVIKTCSSLKVCFTGRELNICCMDKNSLVIKGFIMSISYIL